jgi:NADPH:quinone reductase-like Zn-dependent oxidoreductase
MPAMKAMTHSEYGPPDVLRLADVANPAPAAGEILVRVRAASLNAADWHLLRGEPPIIKLTAGKPKARVPGLDFAGEVEQVGAKVTELRVGDAVFGSGRRGALAEHVCVAAKFAVRKPDTLSFEQAAALPVAGVTALRALRDRAQVRAGQRVLVIGAAGGVGTLAVQIAKALGAEVTGVCSTRNLDMVRSIGADHVLSRFTRQRVLVLLGTVRKSDLAFLAELAAAGKLRPVIDRTYRLAEAAEGFRDLEAGRVRGKLVVLPTAA